MFKLPSERLIHRLLIDAIIPDTTRESLVLDLLLPERRPS